MRREQRSLRTDALTTSICTPLEPSVSHTFGSEGTTAQGRQRRRQQQSCVVGGCKLGEMQQRTHAWPISRLHSGEQTDDREGRRRELDALSVTAMRAGGAFFSALLRIARSALRWAVCTNGGGALMASGDGKEKETAGAAQRSAAQRTACEVSEHDLDTAAAQAGTQAHRTSVDGFQLKERRCDVLPA